MYNSRMCRVTKWEEQLHIWTAAIMAAVCNFDLPLILLCSHYPFFIGSLYVWCNLQLISSKCVVYIHFGCKRARQVKEVDILIHSSSLEEYFKWYPVTCSWRSHWKSQLILAALLWFCPPFFLGFRVI